MCNHEDKNIDQIVMVNCVYEQGPRPKMNPPRSRYATREEFERVQAKILRDYGEVFRRLADA
ncbi:hypothetical protein Dxin01_02778 [Deinococcus xinjiangensis]|uniref:Uncharacterized protein n=1 Tax=Deinococcus xinjiangensis TaxID=457454 RepID=A0ABP9VCR2_9DEIO